MICDRYYQTSFNHTPGYFSFVLRRAQTQRLYLKPVYGCMFIKLLHLWISILEQSREQDSKQKIKSCCPDIPPDIQQISDQQIRMCIMTGPFFKSGKIEISSHARETSVIVTPCFSASSATREMITLSCAAVASYLNFAKASSSARFVPPSPGSLESLPAARALYGVSAMFSSLQYGTISLS